MTSSAPYIISELLIAHGVRNVIVSPGTRNAPLIVAISRTEGLTVYSVVDERTAAFVALGMSLRTNRPVALICTSGSAVLNYAPAVAEAFYSGIPLIVISADRPLRYIDQDKGQTIRQNGILAPIVRGSYDIPCDSEIRDFEPFTARIINDALLKAASGPKKGPVHINVQLDLPSGSVAEPTFPSNRVPIVRVIRPSLRLSHSEVARVATLLEGKRLLIIVGTHRPEASLSRAISRIANIPSVTVMYESQSNIKGLKKGVTALDATITHLSEAEKKVLCPDFVVTVGGTLVTQLLHPWLNANPNVNHWYIGSEVEKGLVDTFGRLSLIFEVNPSTFLSQLAGALSRSDIRINPSYADHWRSKAKQTQLIISEYITSIQWSDLAAVSVLLNNLSSRFNLHISAGMAIRYAQLFPTDRLHAVHTNRGVNGIDGCTSTAVGASINSSNPTLLLTGDTSLDYDFSVLRDEIVPQNFNVCVLNNGGGDIFRIIPATRSLKETPDFISKEKELHCRDYKDIATAFGYKYIRVKSVKKLKEAVEILNIGGGNMKFFIEIDTSQSDNASVYQNLLKSLKP